MTSPVLLAFLNMKPREGDAESAEIIGNPEMRARLIVQIERFPAVALPSVEAPVMVGGAVLSDELAELWMVAGAGFDRELRGILRHLRQLIATAREALAPREIKICVNPDRPGTEKFARALGFTYEKRQALHVFTLNQKGK
jgi:hypothetical protein